jgi:hypothetical protein
MVTPFRIFVTRVSRGCTGRGAQKKHALGGGAGRSQKVGGANSQQHLNIFLTCLLPDLFEGFNVCEPESSFSSVMS